MKWLVKIWTKEINYKNKQTGVDNKFKVQKGILVNNNDKVIFGDIKWFVKREDVDKMLGKEMKGVFNCNISKITTREFTGKNGKNNQYIFQINALQPVNELTAQEYESKIKDILDKENEKSVLEVLE